MLRDVEQRIHKAKGMQLAVGKQLKFRYPPRLRGHKEPCVVRTDNAVGTSGGSQ